MDILYLMDRNFNLRNFNTTIMKEKRKKELESIAKDLAEDDIRKYPLSPEEFFAPGMIGVDINRKKVKSADEILNELVIELPRNHAKPVNQRLFVLEVIADEVKTKGGIILATSFTQQKQERQVTKEIKRYYVIDVAHDCTLSFIPYGEKEKRIVQRGDEVFPFFPEEMLEWSIPRIIDWDNSAARYCVVHESELAGASASLVAEGD